MNTVTLGRTGLAVPQNGFGALPIQRIPKADAVRLLRRAFDGGIYVPIDGWRIRVECRRGGRVVFSEERPFPISLSPDTGGESPDEPK